MSSHHIIVAPSTFQDLQISDDSILINYNPFLQIPAAYSGKSFLERRNSFVPFDMSCKIFRQTKESNPTPSLLGPATSICCWLQFFAFHLEDDHRRSDAVMCLITFFLVHLCHRCDVKDLLNGLVRRSIKRC